MYAQFVGPLFDIADYLQSPSDSKEVYLLTWMPVDQTNQSHTSRIISHAWLTKSKWIVTEQMINENIIQFLKIF